MHRVEVLRRKASCVFAVYLHCGRWYAVGLVLLWNFLGVACDVIVPRPFVPQTADQQSIARTLETFLLALHQHNAIALRATLTVDATITTVLEGTKLFTKSYHAVEQHYLQESLLVAEPTVPLVNFQQPAPDRATLETFLVTTPTIDTIEKKEVRWHLQRQQENWLISAITESSATEDVHIKVYGGGP